MPYKTDTLTLQGRTRLLMDQDGRCAQCKAPRGRKIVRAPGGYWYDMEDGPDGGWKDAKGQRCDLPPTGTGRYTGMVSGTTCIRIQLLVWAEPGKDAVLLCQVCHSRQRDAVACY
jgi:hypothetical protein